MIITLIAIGKTDSNSLQALIDEYSKRLKHYVRFELVFLPDIRHSKNMSENEQKKKEGDLIISRLKKTDILILLDENGTNFNSIKFADYIQKHMNSGIKNLVFAIGGPYGFSKEIYDRAKGKVSLSKMTFSHQMIRLFITEQLYRAFTILRNEPYHHR